MKLLDSFEVGQVSGADSQSAAIGCTLAALSTGIAFATGNVLLGVALYFGALASCNAGLEQNW
jgi:hypothetical protein